MNRPLLRCALLLGCFGIGECRAQDRHQSSPLPPASFPFSIFQYGDHGGTTFYQYEPGMPGTFSIYNYQTGERTFYSSSPSVPSLPSPSHNTHRHEWKWNSMTDHEDDNEGYSDDHE